MVKGFTFGKFLPFHKGHEEMIRFAASRCDRLSVLVCASDRELIAGETRKKWMEHTLRDIPGLEVLVFEYDENEYPNSSVSSRDISMKWASVFRRLFPDHLLVFTSEVYGNYVAGYMGIGHISFDLSRSRVPVSATGIRSDLFRFWNYLPDAVKRDLAIKVVLLGTESTGKTTLTRLLSEHYHCTAVMEAGRDLIPDSNNFGISDLYVVAKEHARLIRDAEIAGSPLIIIDTDIHITASYCRFSFNRHLDVDEEIYRVNKAGLYLYLNNDVPFIQDGTRMAESQRNRLDQSHRSILSDRDIRYAEITGENWQSREDQAIMEIDRLIEMQNKLYHEI